MRSIKAVKRWPNRSREKFSRKVFCAFAPNVSSSFGSSNPLASKSFDLEEEMRVERAWKPRDNGQADRLNERERMNQPMVRLVGRSRAWVVKRSSNSTAKAQLDNPLASEFPLAIERVSNRPIHADIR
jgi:hypothetical protein